MQPWKRHGKKLQYKNNNLVGMIMINAIDLDPNGSTVIDARYKL